MIRLIGDIHGCTAEYASIIQDVDCSVQLGDMGFSDEYSFIKANVDHTKHRFVPGNHDNYDDLPPHAYQQDWGIETLNGVEFCYIRGADSVDKHRRTIGISWWEQEQISWSSGLELIELIKQRRPRIILSHDCPINCMDVGRIEEPIEVRRRRGVVTNKSKLNLSITTQILTKVFEVHQPQLWVFGHHHHDWRLEIDGCQFVCLDSGQHIDINDSCVIIN